MKPPQLLVLGGPNGAGKSTTARALLVESMGVVQFVNADSIAVGLSPFAPETTAIQAGKMMIRRIRTLLHARHSLGFETTLAGKRHGELIKDARGAGYFVHLIYIWLASPRLAVQRVADRVRQGGHAVPDETVERRYYRGLANFFRLYRALASTWTLCDNSSSELAIVAQGTDVGHTRVYDAEALARIEGSNRHA